MVAFGRSERSHRGLVQRFAKPPCGVTCIEGSNPSLSATALRDPRPLGALAGPLLAHAPSGALAPVLRRRLPIGHVSVPRRTGSDDPPSRRTPCHRTHLAVPRPQMPATSAASRLGGGLRHGRGTLRRVRALRSRTACARSSVDRALGCGPKGREFESRRARHLPAVLTATADVGDRRAACGSPRLTRQAMAPYGEPPARSRPREAVDERPDTRPSVSAARPALRDPRDLRPRPEADLTRWI